jgi:hypothetical protein
MSTHRATKNKERLTVTVDPALVRAGNDAVRAGHASSLSSWVNLALAERAAKEHRLDAMADAIDAYEARFGVISTEEMRTRSRADKRASKTAHVAKRRGRVA